MVLFGLFDSTFLIRFDTSATEDFFFILVSYEEQFPPGRNLHQFLGFVYCISGEGIVLKTLFSPTNC